MFSLTKIFGDANEKYVKSLNPILDKIDSLEEVFQSLEKEDLQKKTQKYKDRNTKGKS